MKHIIGKQSDKQTWKWLLEQSRGQYVRMVVLIVGNSVFASSSIIFALMCRGIIDAVVAGYKTGIGRYGLGLLAMLWGALAIYAVDSLYIRDCNHCKTMYNVIRSYLG